MTFDAILAEALKLSPRERERLALRLSMAETGDIEEVPAAHAELLHGRLAEHEAGAATSMSAEESLREARRHLTEHRGSRSGDSESA